MNHFFQKIQRAKNGDEECLLELLRDFQPLLRKYGFWTGFEDGFEELQVFFIALIKKFPIERFSDENEGQTVMYLRVSVRNRANDIRCRFFSESEQSVEDLEVAAQENEQMMWMSWEGVLKELTALQYQVIVKNIWGRESSAEIARELHISRQAVNQAKMRGLERLRDILEVKAERGR